MFKYFIFTLSTDSSSFESNDNGCMTVEKLSFYGTKIAK